MKTYHQEIDLKKTKKKYDFKDITKKVEKVVKDSGVKNGLVNVQSKHTSSAVYVNENEPLLLKDMKQNWSDLFSAKKSYQHDDFKVRTVNMCKGECENGHSHLNAVLLGTSVTLNIVRGKIRFGKWQRVFFVELDRPRTRVVSVMVIGEDA
ncbi:secondary thiamine-phosphate synthase enzyme YjbQ [Patescibacteria group bacterium]